MNLYLCSCLRNGSDYDERNWGLIQAPSEDWALKLMQRESGGHDFKVWDFRATHIGTSLDDSCAKYIMHCDGPGNNASVSLEEITKQSLTA